MSEEKFTPEEIRQARALLRCLGPPERVAEVIDGVSRLSDNSETLLSVCDLMEDAGMQETIETIDAFARVAAFTKRTFGWLAVVAIPLIAFRKEILGWLAGGK